MKLSIPHSKRIVEKVADTANRGWNPFPARATTIKVWHIALGAVLLLGVLMGCQAALASRNPSADVWSGFLEGKTLDVSAEVGGRLTAVSVQEGDRVQAGAPLVTIDDEMARLKLDAADAEVAAAQAQLALLQAPPRPEDLARAQAGVDQAAAGLAEATQAVTDTQAIRANPQELQIAQAQAETNVEAAQHALDAAARQAEGADLVVQFWHDEQDMLQDGVTVVSPFVGSIHFDTPVTRMVDAEEERNKADNDAWQAWIHAAQANADLAAAQAGLKNVADQLANPIALDTRVDQARAARDQAAAKLQSAQAALQALNEGASPAQIQADRDALDQALASRASLQQELTHYRLVAPRAGVVETTFYRVGEVVGPSAPLVRLRVEDNLTLQVYVPMSALSGIHVDQQVPVWVAELNDKSAQGRVTRIADQAEFTSRQSQTDSERNALLVAVEITLPNSDGQMKAGMPASVSFTASAPSPAVTSASVSSSGSATFSGTLEAKQTRIAAELSGDVDAVRVANGDDVQAGDTLVELNRRDIQSDVDASSASVRAAQSNLDQVNEAARPGTVAVAQAALTDGNADLSGAKTALIDSTRALDSRQEIVGQVQLWKGKALSAQAGVSQARAGLASLDDQTQQAERDLSMAGKVQSAVRQKQYQAAQSSLLAAQATFSGTMKVYASYQQMFDQPLELIAAQHAAESQVQVAQAGVRVAQAELEMVTRGPQPESVDLAQARLRAAQTGLGLAQAQAKRYFITSPIEGTVLDRSVEVGETVQPGAPLLTIADTRELELTVYVPLRSFDVVALGQPATIRLPSLPGKAFAAKVTYISPESEFKPANIYNSQERSEMVFAVKLTVPNPGRELKAGLPADATLGQ